MVKRLSFGLIFLFFLGPLSAQTTKELVDQDTTTIQALDTLSQEIITVFLDCEVCDNNFIRQQINFVNYVRDPTLGQLHLFITSQGTAGGGRVFTLSFIGKQRFLDINNTLSYSSVQTNTRDEEREGLNSMITLGLVPYVAHTSMAENYWFPFQTLILNKDPKKTNGKIGFLKFMEELTSPKKQV